MAISRAMRAALHALSQSAEAFEIGKTYRLERAIEQASAMLSASPQASDYLVERDGREIRIRLYHPTRRKDMRLLFFFHGGGWVHETIDTYNKVCQTLADESGWCVASVDYALAPEHPFPHGLEDCYAVVKRFHENPAWLNASSGEIFLVGDSAGGNLVAALSLLARDRGEFAVAKQILIYPATASDHTEQSPYPSVHENGEDYLLTRKRVQDYIELYAGGCSEHLTNPYFAPIYAKDKTNQPQTLLISAEYDPLRDEGEAYAVQLKHSGNTVLLFRMEDALHGYFSLSTRFSQVRQTHWLINDFLNGEKLYESIKAQKKNT